MATPQSRARAGPGKSRSFRSFQRESGFPSMRSPTPRAHSAREVAWDSYLSPDPQTRAAGPEGPQCLVALDGIEGVPQVRESLVQGIRAQSGLVLRGAEGGAHGFQGGLY